jgi:Protein of unknown function (DUF3800)
MFRVFFDESTDQHQKNIVYIGGFVGRWEQWAKIEWRWAALLQEYDIRYYRAYEAEHAKGEFDKPPYRTNKDYLTDDQRELLREVRRRFFSSIIEAKVSGVGIGVPVDEFNAVANTTEKRDKFGGTPYYLCGHLAIMSIMHAIVTEVRSKELVAFIFDQQYEYEAEMKRVTSELGKKPSPYTAQLGSTDFADKKKYIQLQVADLLVYEVRKDYEIRLTKPDVPDREALRFLKEHRKISRISLCGTECLEWYLKYGEIPD